MTILTLNEVQYAFEKVTKAAASGPIVTLKTDDIVVLNEMNLNSPTGQIIFFKRDGRYLILAGKELYLAAISSPKFNNEVKGHLISTVALKKARLNNF